MTRAGEAVAGARETVVHLVALGVLLAVAELVLTFGLGQPDRRLARVIVTADLALGLVAAAVVLLAGDLRRRWIHLGALLAPLWLLAAWWPWPWGHLRLAAVLAAGSTWVAVAALRQDAPVVAFRRAACSLWLLAMVAGVLQAGGPSAAAGLGLLAGLAAWRPRVVGLLGIGLLGAAWAWDETPRWTHHGVAPARSASPRPSVILLTLDTVRADHLSLYGYARRTTPWLDDFARRGVVFEHAYSNDTYTVASHASLFTGLLPSAHGARHTTESGAGDVLGTEAETLAESLGRLGLRRAAIVANAGYLAPRTGLARGFQEYLVVEPSWLKYRPIAMEVARHWLGPEVDRYKRPARTVLAEARRWIDRQSEPFFLFVNLIDAHAPYDPPAEWQRRFLDGPRPSAQRAEDIVTLRRRPTPEEVAALVALYDGEIASMDHELGRFFSGLEGRLQNTIVIVTSDHGELFGEHGFFQHSTDPYEGAIRVPLAIVHPAGPTLRSARRVGLHELKAVIEDLVAGGDLRDHVAGTGDEVVVVEHWFSNFDLDHFHPLVRWPAARAILAGPHKLIERQGGPTELFDLRRDPGEARGVAGPPQIPEEVARVLRTLPPVGVGRLGAAPRPEAGDLEKLRALGYVQ